MDNTSLQDLLHKELQKLKGMEEQMLEAPPLMEQFATSQEVKQIFTKHTPETQEQVQPLETLMKTVGVTESIEDKTMTTLLREGQLLAQNTNDALARDAVIISGAEKVEHYEMACYDSALTLAIVMADIPSIMIFTKILAEERTSAEKLHKIATRLLI